MPKFLVSLAMVLFLWVNISHAQYVVTKVIGRIKFENGEYIKNGTKLYPGSKLQYESPGAAVRTIGPDAKIHIFSANSASATQSGGVFSQLLSQFIPTATSGSFSSRGGNTIDFVEAELDNRAGNGNIIIGNVNKYLFNKQKYPVGGGNRFFIELSAASGNYNTRRALHTFNDTLVINYVDLLPQDGDVSNINYRLGFVRNGMSEAIINFKPYFDVTNDLATITATVIASLNGQGIAKDSVMQLCLQQVYEAAGKPSAIDFYNIFNYAYDKQNLSAPLNGLHGTGYLADAPNSIPNVSARVYSLTRAALPSAATLRKYAPPVGDQGNTGTCTAWASAYAARSISYNYTYQLTDEFKNDKYKFSPEFVYFKIRANDGCANGTNIYQAIKAMSAEGDVMKDDFTFNCGMQFTENDRQSAMKFVIKGGKNLFTGNVINNIKEAVALESRPVIIAINIPNYSETQPYSFANIQQDGIWRLSVADYNFLAAPNQYNGHALCITGYDDNVNGGSFEVMNSWGASWGNKGFFWLNYDDFKKVANIACTITDLLPPPVVVKVDTVVVPPPTPIPQYVRQEYLTGTLKFFEVDASGGSIAPMPVAKIEASRSTAVTNDVVVPAGLPAYRIDKVLANGARYKIEYDSKSPCFAYLLSYDGTETDVLFPAPGESALIDAAEAGLYLPAKSKSYTLGATAATEHMCLIISKAEINIADITNNLKAAGSDADLFAVIKNSLPNLLPASENVTAANNNIIFNAATDGRQPLVLFINLKHQ